MDSNSQAQAENKKDHEMEQFLSSRFKDQINLGTLEGTKEERDLDVAPTSRVPNEQVKSNATASSASHAEETSSIISQGPANAEIIGEPFKPKQERKLEYDAAHTYRVPNLLGKSNAVGSSMSFMTNKRNYSRMEQSSHCMTNIHANIRNHWLQVETTQMAKRRNYTRMRQSPAWMTECLASFLKSEPPRATTQMALDEVSKVEGLNDTQILRAVDLLMNDQRKFDTFSGLPNRLRRTWLQMHLGDQF